YWDWAKYMAMVNPPIPGQRIKGDFNNDGREDAAVVYDYGNNTVGIWMFLSTGTGFSAPVRWWMATAGTFDPTRAKWVAGDFTGDGKTDIAAVYDNGNVTMSLLVFSSTGSSFTGWVTWWQSAAGQWDWTKATPLAGDFNADGKTDIAASYDYGNNNMSLLVFKSTGTSFLTWTTWWAAGAGQWDSTKAKLVAGDFNNDLKTDIAALYDYGNFDNRFLVFKSTGTAFSTWTTWWSSGVNGWNATKSTLVVGDFNGDGKKDVGAFYDYGNNNMSLLVFPSTGTSFSTWATWWSSGVGGWDSTKAKPLAGDFTGDGKADVAALYNYGNNTSKLLVFPSTGSTFQTWAAWWASNAGDWDWFRSNPF
ncbi:MAG: FG-GAP repeat domain-containing protein, partial [Limisphaerales bacterium]